MLTYASIKYLHVQNGLEDYLALQLCLEHVQVRVHVTFHHCFCLHCWHAGGNIASSWAVLQCMGEDGYMVIAERLMAVATRIKDGISGIEV